MKVKDEIIRAKIQFQRENPFFAYLISHLKPNVENDIPTCGVDRDGNLFYNEEFMGSLNEDELKTILCHEVMHVALEHLVRYGSRDRHIMNIACDLCVNDILMSSDFTMPRGDYIIPDQNHSYRVTPDLIVKNIHKKCAEEIYDEIYPKLSKMKKRLQELIKKLIDKHILKPGSGKKGGYGLEIEIEIGKGGKGKGRGKVGKNWKKILAEASAYAKMQGKLPAGIERLVEDTLKSKVNWRDLLYKYITREIPFDYTYSYPSKKSISTGIYMPSTVKEQVDIAIAIDTSGSISKKELAEFLGEVIGVANSFSSVRMTLLTCDAKVHDVYEVNNGSVETIKKLKIRGGGGTDFRPVFKHLKKNKPASRLLIYLTDGWGDFPKTEEIKTVWVLSNDSLDPEKIPFGQVIKL